MVLLQNKCAGNSATDICEEYYRAYYCKLEE